LNFFKSISSPSRDHLLGKLLGAKSNTTRQEAPVKGSSALGTGVVRFRILSSVGGCCLVAWNKSRKRQESGISRYILNLRL